MKADMVFTGKRKTCVARLVVRPGKGGIYINDAPLESIQNTIMTSKITAPLVLATDYWRSHNFFFKIEGGGPVAACDAAAAALAKALVENNPGLRDQLLTFDRSLLVDDPRQAEPKKPNRRSARRFKQKSYR
ncbi:MAG: 30S ribosomal protein S9 [Nitrososphaerota archaeon]